MKHQHVSRPSTDPLHPARRGSLTDELVELERVDLAGVVALEALPNVVDQPRELGLVVGADGSPRRARSAFDGSAGARVSLSGLPTAINCGIYSATCCAGGKP